MAEQLLKAFGFAYLFVYGASIIKIALDGGIHLALGHTYEKKDTYELRKNLKICIVFFLFSVSTWATLFKSTDKAVFLITMYSIVLYVPSRNYFSKEH